MSKSRSIVHFISSLHYGGAEQVLMTLVQGLANQGYHQTVLYIHDGPHKKTLQNLGIATYHVQGLFFRYDLIFFIRLVRLLRRLNPDLVHTSLWAANCFGRLSAWLLSIPVVQAYHNKASLDGNVRNTIDRYTGARFAPAVAVSHDAALSLTQKGINPQKITVIANGVRCNERTIIPEQKQDTFIIGMIARFHPVKNHATLLAALAELKEKNYRFKALFIGDGVDVAIQELVAMYQLNDLVEIIKGQSSAPYMKLLDCCVLPSFSEGLPMVLLEAMAGGIACVVSHEANGAQLIKHNETGLLFSAHNAAELAHQLQLLIDQRSLGQNLGQQGQKIIMHHYSSETMIQRYHELFAAMAERRVCR